MNFQDFSFNCKKGLCLRRTIKSKRCSKESKQHSCYDKYIKQQEKDYIKKKKIDVKWEEVKKLVWVRDKGECQFLRCLTREEWLEYADNAKYSDLIIDTAHVFGRGSHIKLKYDIENLVLVNRRAHSFLDTHKSPLTGKHIGKEELNMWWERILGKNRYEDLQKKVKCVII